MTQETEVQSCNDILPGNGNGNSNNSDALLIKYDIALQGNGHDKDLSQEQVSMIFELYERSREQRSRLLEAYPNDVHFTDHDTCRRYLVARQWNLGAAQTQYESTLTWRRTQRAGREFGHFHASPRPAKNPYAMDMRIVGWDVEGRPICLSCMAEAHDRFDSHDNAIHMELLMEACCQVIYDRRRAGYNTMARSRQWIFVVDFIGFSWRDQNPKSGILTAHLMQHYPELMHAVLLIQAPTVFYGVYSIIQPFLDERVRQKVMFLSKKRQNVAFPDNIRHRIGDSACDWIATELQDSTLQRKDKTRKKGYWEPSPCTPNHDPRGMKEYVESQFYIQTPGDAFQKTQNVEPNMEPEE